MQVGMVAAVPLTDARLAANSRPHACGTGDVSRPFPLHAGTAFVPARPTSDRVARASRLGHRWQEGVGHGTPPDGGTAAFFHGSGALLGSSSPRRAEGPSRQGSCSTLAQTIERGRGGRDFEQ